MLVVEDLTHLRVSATHFKQFTKFQAASVSHKISLSTGDGITFYTIFLIVFASILYSLFRIVSHKCSRE